MGESTGGFAVVVAVLVCLRVGVAPAFGAIGSWFSVELERSACGHAVGAGGDAVDHGVSAMCSWLTRERYGRCVQFLGGIRDAIGGGSLSPVGVAVDEAQGWVYCG